MSYIRMSLSSADVRLNTVGTLEFAQTGTLTAKRLYDDVTSVSCL